MKETHAVNVDDETTRNDLQLLLCKHLKKPNSRKKMYLIFGKKIPELPQATLLYIIFLIVTC